MRTLDYGRWVSGEDEDVDLWFGTLNLEHEHAFAPYAWLQGTPCCAGCGAASRPCGGD